MAIRRTMFVLAVPDLARSAAFYRDVLGSEIREMGDPGYLVVDDVDAYHERVAVEGNAPS